MNKKRFYITTPIYYVNSKPHIGSLYSTLIADVIARYYRSRDYDVQFLTGTDEHGQKVYDAAQEKKRDTQEMVDELASVFEKEFKKYDIQYTIFMRTTYPFHKIAVQNWIRKMQREGFVYKDVYEGWYSVASEAFLTEKDCEHKNEQGVPICPISGKAALWLKQEAYFFKLSAFQDRILQFLNNNPDFIVPRERTQEIINFVASGLKDLCISRLKKSLSWGISFPDDDDHVVYVWADALNNYITAIGFLSDDKEKQKQFNTFWPCDVHVLGKDILRFHVAYWLAFLMASDLPLPKRELVHGWILCNNQKMSKSLGNTITPDDLINRYENIDKIRYFFIRYLPITQDSSFSFEEFDERTNADLADALGNLVQRVLVLSQKTVGNKIRAPLQWGDASQELYKKSQEMHKNILNELDNYMLHRLTAHIWAFIHSINEFFHSQEPWKLAKTDMNSCQEIISATLHAVYSVSAAIWPLMPQSALKIAQALGVAIIDFYNPLPLNIITHAWDKTFDIVISHEILFKKIEIEKQKSVLQDNNTQERNDEKKSSKDEQISIEDFKKVELRVGLIELVEEVPKSNKLYKLSVNFGEYGKRTICSGIKQWYKLEDLLNKKAVFLFNIAPRKLMGIESHGMILTSKNVQGEPLVVFAHQDSVLGSLLS